jgi:hypothetical protein
MMNLPLISKNIDQNIKCIKKIMRIHAHIKKKVKRFKRIKQNEKFHSFIERSSLGKFTSKL